MKSKKILVLGGTGLVGRSILRKLISDGFENIIATYNSRKPEHSECEFLKIDLKKQEDTEELFKKVKPEWVFLCAAKVGGILANNTYKAEFIYDNLAIAINTINSAYKYKVKKLLNLGSSCIYPKLAPQPLKEEYLLTSSLEPTNEPYAIAKIAAIKLCRYYNEQYGTNFISVMPTNLYGPNDNFDLYTSHVLPALIRKFHLAKALENEDWDTIKKDLNFYPIEGTTGNASKEVILKILSKYGINIEDSKTVTVNIWGTGEVFREFLHVDDLADACVFLMKTLDAPEMKKWSQDYFLNIGVGKDIKIKELVLLVKDIVGFKGKINFDHTKPDGTPRKLLDVSKINSLGWKSKIDLETGIQQTYKWYLTRINSMC